MSLQPTSERNIVAAFDFDVTITTKDTFVPFLYRAFGGNRVRSTFSKLSLDAMGVVLGLSNRDRFKEKVVAALFLGEPIDRLRQEGQEYAKSIVGLVRPSAMRRIEWHKEQGHRLVMVSASLDLYLEPIAEMLGFNDLLCTKLSTNHLIFDGKLAGPNCRGPEKAKRLQALLGNMSGYEIYAYGDSAGDREMLAAADHPHYRFFNF